MFTLVALKLLLIAQLQKNPKGSEILNCVIYRKIQLRSNQDMDKYFSDAKGPPAIISLKRATLFFKAISLARKKPEKSFQVGYAVRYVTRSGVTSILIGIDRKSLLCSSIPTGNRQFVVLRKPFYGYPLDPPGKLAP